MSATKITNPTPGEFTTWISNYPESYHPLDMKRFYILVKTIYKYGSKQQQNGAWLCSEINNYKNHNLKKKDIDYYCDLFDKLIDFCKAIKNL
jgi:hypothetical protein